MGIAHGRSFDVASYGLSSFERRRAQERAQAGQKREASRPTLTWREIVRFEFVALLNVSQSTSVSQNVQVGDNYVNRVREGIGKQEEFNWV